MTASLRSGASFNGRGASDKRLEYVGTKPGREPISLEEAHRELEISPEEFDAVAAELARSLDFFNVPQGEKDEVLAAFAGHKGEVTEGAMAVE